MFFVELHRALVERLRARIMNGESTERGLARAVGLSQPHIHNVLSGKRTLSPEAADQILFHLRLSLLDLIDQTTLARHVEVSKDNGYDAAQHCYVPILKGKLGPGHPWPVAVEEHEFLRVKAVALAKMQHPVVVRLSDDDGMHPLFCEGDRALLDQSHAARTHIDPSACYVVKVGQVGLVRRLRWVGRRLHMFSEDAAERPAAWQELNTEEHAVSYYVRAKARFIAPDYDWV